MGKKRIAIYGAGALARQIINYNLRYNLFEITCLIDDNILHRQSFMGFKVLSFEQYLEVYKNVPVIVSIGYLKCNEYRRSAIAKVLNAGCYLCNFVSPGANVWPGSIKDDDNVLVFDNTFVGVGCKLERGVIVSEGTILSHDIIVGENTFISDGVVVGGHCRIGKNSFLGLNSTIKSNTSLGDYNVVGCASNVLKDTADYSVTKGNPGVSERRDTLNVAF